MRRFNWLAISALLLTVFVFAGLPNRANAAGTLSNLQFHIGCSSFTASADALNGFAFFVDHSDPNMSAGYFQLGTGHITIQANYGVTLPQGTPIFYIYGDKSAPYGTGTVPCSDSNTSNPVPFTDGRLDKFNAGQTVALYCSTDSFSFWAVNKGIGFFAFRISKADLAKFPAKQQNYLIKQAKGVRLYRLSSGELQVDRAMEDGTDYHFIFHDSDCAA